MEWRCLPASRALWHHQLRATVGAEIHRCGTECAGGRARDVVGARPFKLAAAPQLCQLRVWLRRRKGWQNAVARTQHAGRLVHCCVHHILIRKRTWPSAPASLDRPVGSLLKVGPSRRVVSALQSAVRVPRDSSQGRVRRAAVECRGPLPALANEVIA